MEHQRSDGELAAATQHALRWDVCVPPTVTARVEQGEVILEGQVTWNHERDAAERAVRYLVGVSAVSNEITLFFGPSAAPRASAGGDYLEFQVSGDQSAD